MSALASATRVFWPAESCPAGRSNNSAKIKLLGQFPDPPLEPRHVIEMAVDTQILRYRKPVRE